MEATKRRAFGVAAILLLATSCCAPAAAVSLRHLPPNADDDAPDGNPFPGHAVWGPSDEAEHSALLEVEDAQGQFESLNSWLHVNETFESLHASIIRDRRQIEVLPISNCSRLGSTGGVPGVPGFQFSHFGHFSNETRRRTCKNVNCCNSVCLETPGCNAFSFENMGPTRMCMTYNGKLPTYSRAARSYKKCARHEKARKTCMNSDGIKNYTFTHEGWFPNGIEMESTKTPEGCSKVCSGHGTCTAFSWLKPHKENDMKPECIMYTTRRTLKSESLAYTRCYIKN